jgi:sulfide:quinone oxidoreductase
MAADPDTTAEPDVHQPTDGAFEVVIAGAGVAGLEAALALRDLAGERVSVTMLAPEEDFVYRPMAVTEPFSYGQAQRYALRPIAAELGMQLRVSRFSWLAAEERLAHLDDGEALGYDALLLALGARIHTRYPHAHTVDDRHLEDILHGLIQDVEGGYVRRLAFVIPGRMGWQLPIYELALMTANRAYDMGVDAKVVIVTPEDAPLGLFGTGASEGVAALLQEAEIETITSAYAEVPHWNTVVVNPGDRRLEVDRVVALPELYGPAVRGLPVAEHGFIPIDVHAKVRGVERVYAAGDATDCAVKHGGVAAQEADVAARAIASLAGARVELEIFKPVVHGMLLTGREPRYLSARITGGHGFSSEITDEPTWSPPRKIVAEYLAPYLEGLQPR